MAAPFVGHTFNSISGPSVPVTTHASTQIGDLVLVQFSSHDPDAAPAVLTGWTLEVDFTAALDGFRVWSRIATIAGAVTHNWATDGASGQFRAATYRDTPGVAAVASGFVASALSFTAPSVSSIATERVVSFWTTSSMTAPTFDAASNERMFANSAGGIYDKVGGPGIVTGTTLTTSSLSSFNAVSLALLPTNVAPNAPDLLSLTGNPSLDRAQVNRARWAFSDPDASDSQSKFTLDYSIGGVAQTPIVQVTPNQFYDFPAGLAAGAVEWGVVTTDNGSPALDGPRSVSGHFTLADVPTGATITSHVNGATVERYETLTWSVPDQEAFQVRRVADLAGVADDTEIYEDSGEVVEPATRSYDLDFSVNNRAEHMQVRSKLDGLWQAEWTTVAVNVTYDPPPPPTFEIQPDEDTASLLIPIGNPTPTGDEPAADYNDIHIDDGDGNGERRVATLVPVNTAYRYWTPRSGVNYSSRVRIEAVAANGATASSAG